MTTLTSEKGPLAARGATMWWLAAADLYRSALSGDQLILVVRGCVAGFNPNCALASPSAGCQPMTEHFRGI